MTSRGKALRSALPLALLLALTGCATLPDLAKALAKDNASVCVSIKNMLYGTLTACRTNASGIAVIGAKGDGSITIQHSGGPR